MPIDFNNAPYNDDFLAENGPRENNYMRILFKPGYAVQARELTQLQSIIQNQIKMFGDHIFKEGSQVTGGHLTYDNSVISLKLEEQFGGVDIRLTDFLNRIIVNDVGTTVKKAKVIAADDTQENKTIMIRYIRGNAFEDSDVIRVATGQTTKATLISPNSVATGSIVSINQGIFYVNGFFVNVEEQSIVLDPYSRTPTYRVGLEIQETIIDESADATLLDPAQESFNYQAPGADRYQFSLVLAKRTLNSIDDSSFFELIRIENGIITKQVKYPVYSEIEKTLARRTFDESGNYTVFPFRASPSEHPTDDSKLIIDVEPGKAYVKGFEFETIGTTPITINKARTTELVTDYDLSLEFGNSITVKNFYSGNTGIFDTTQFANLDMHLVPTANINTTNSIEYTKTLVGNAKAKSLQKNGANKYDLFIIDQNLLSNTFNVVTATANTFTFPPSYPTTPIGLYDGVSFSVISGTGSGQQGRILTYDSSRVATIEGEFDTILDNSSYVTLNYGIKDVDSIVVRPTIFYPESFGGQNANSAIYPSMDVDSLSKSNKGDTYLSRANFDRLIYTLPETAISNNFDNIDFYHRKLLLDREFLNGTFVVGFPTGGSNQEEFYYGTDGSYLSPSVVDTNFIVTVRDKQSSNFKNGQVLSLYHDGASNGAFRVTDKSVELRQGNITFRGDVFVNVRVRNAVPDGTGGIVKLKTIKGNKAAITSVDFINATQPVTGQSGTKIDAENGVVWFTNYSDIKKLPGDKQSLFISDVVKINKVYDSANPQYRPNSSNAIDITDHYLFDTGQRDNYYDHAAIILKDGKNPPIGQTAVLLTYFQHQAGEGFFNRQSYNDGVIANNFVAVYTSTALGSISLIDAIDFRPRRIDYTTDFTFTGLKLPYTDLSMELNYGYYLPRIDKLVVTSNKEFKVLTGIPSKYPKIPEDIADAMTLYTMFIPPYTNKAKDVKLQFHENRRYTMRDIGRIEKRVDRLEYYTQLSLLEQQTRDETYFYEDREIEKEKYGILVEQFDGFNIADNKNPDLLCHISFNQLKPYKKITPVKMNLIGNTGSYILNNKTYSIEYTEEEMILQNTATKSVVVQPYLFGTFNGFVTLEPEVDTFYSQTLQSSVTSTDAAQNDRPPGGVSEQTTTETATGIPAGEDPPPNEQVGATDSGVQETVTTTVVTQTGDVITQDGYDSTLFDNADDQAEVVSEVVSTIVTNSVAAGGMGIVLPGIIPIGDLTGGMSQFTLAYGATQTYSGYVSTPEPQIRLSTVGSGGRGIVFNAQTVRSLARE